MGTNSNAPVKFRGKDTCIERLYRAVTQAPRGKGKQVGFASMLSDANLTCKGKFSFSTEAMSQAFKALEARGVLEYTHQKAGRPGRNERMYRVLVDFDPALLPDSSSSRKKAAKKPATKKNKVRHESAPVDVTPVVAVDTLVDRVAKLEATVTALRAALSA